MARPQLMLIDEISEGLQPSVIERIAQVLRREREIKRNRYVVDRAEYRIRPRDR